MFSGFAALPEIPADTARATRNVFNVQHVYVRIGDEVETIWNQVNDNLLDSTSSLAAGTAIRLALVTTFQYAEDMPDPAASVATSHRLDWKYALRLPVKHPGIAPDSLCQFRQNMFASSSGMREYAAVLTRTYELGLFAWPISSGMIDPRESLITVCMITRLQNLKLRMKSLIGCLAVSMPEWMRANAMAHWYTRYSTSQLGYPGHSSMNSLNNNAIAIGLDIQRLLEMLPEPECLPADCQIQIRKMHADWQEEFTIEGDTIRWHLPGCSPCDCRHLGDQPQ